MQTFSIWLNTLKEDIYVFRLVFGRGFGKYIYFPAFRVIIIFRLSQLFYKNKLTRPLSYLLTNINDLFHGIWIGARVQVGKGFSVPHPRGIIINPDSIIGDYCSILHQVTLGGDRIVIGNNVEILVGVKIINDKLHEKTLYIGNNAVLAASSVILKDVPNNAVMAGIPARIVKYRDNEDTWLNYRLKNII